MGEGKIAVAVKEGKLVASQQISKLGVHDIALLIAQIDLIKLDLLIAYKSLCKRESG